MTSDPWKDFGYAVRQARLDLGWTLEQLATEALNNGARKGYVGQVEKGARNLSAETIDKFDQALSLPADVVKAAHLAPPPSKSTADEDKRDQDAERLLARVAKDDTVAPVAEALLTTLAYEFAGSQTRDLQTAYIALRQALEAAENIRRRGEMPPDNTGSQLNAVMAEVAKLNDAGDRDAADALLDAEERRMREEHQAEKERLAQQTKALLDRRLDQDRLRNRPDLAAERLIADVRQQQDRGKLFLAVNALANEWSEKGNLSGDIFALRVAVQIARHNWDKHKGKRMLEAAALRTLGSSYFRVAQRSARPRDLELAHNAFEGALKKTSKTAEPEDWAARQDGLGCVLNEMGEQAENADVLRDAVAAHRAALAVEQNLKTPVQIETIWNNLGGALQKLGEVTKDPVPVTEAVTALETALSLNDKEADALDWELTQNNLALALRWQGALNKDRAVLDRARAAYRACEELDLCEKAASWWARLQWNIADLALARFELDPDPALLEEADSHVRAAREVFVDGSDYQTQRCDDLISQIEAARGRL
ncbi:helix-turn-helix transcriptional regulator [uncultured Tateyamaria sp.]|uniref:helix-turn-helix domain-containing protein n=1 Tax=uncultured Tateyamaria sp. TaxID=455651 RepID=UPI002634CDBC|nr:helix-turn-helix transcriptional regulator [uncultured Tateyamaria sp.]